MICSLIQPIVHLHLPSSSVIEMVAGAPSITSSEGTDDTKLALYCSISSNAIISSLMTKRGRNSNIDDGVKLMSTFIILNPDVSTVSGCGAGSKEV